MITIFITLIIATAVLFICVMSIDLLVANSPPKVKKQTDQKRQNVAKAEPHESIESTDSS
jgi:hypothetical protein